MYIMPLGSFCACSEFFFLFDQQFLLSQKPSHQVQSCSLKVCFLKPFFEIFGTINQDITQYTSLFKDLLDL